MQNIQSTPQYPATGPSAVSINIFGAQVQPAPPAQVQQPLQGPAQDTFERAPEEAQTQST